MNDLYDSLADDYDALHPREEIFSQREFFQKIIADYGIESCLDAACGTGWHLALFDELGLQCFGSDLSPAMLGKAKLNLAAKNIPLQLEDFRTLSQSWKQQVDMVVCLTTSLPHLLTDEDVITALNSMYERLNEGGVLVISNGISDRLLDDKPKFIPARVHQDQAFYFFLEYPSPKQVIFNILHINNTAHGFDHSFNTTVYFAMRQDDLRQCFQKTSFGKVDYFGDVDFTPYSRTNSDRLIAIAHKQAEIIL